MAKKKKSQLSAEGKTELAKAIAEKSQTFAKTYASVEISITKFFRWLSGWVDKLLFNQKHGKLVALILAVMFYFMINAGGDQFNIFAPGREAKALNDVLVSTIVSEQAYEVSGVPTSVNLEVIGEMSDLQLINLQDNYQVVADLSGLTEGTHEVTLQAKNFSPRLDVSIKPSTAMVTIRKKESKRFTLGYDFVNTSQMDNIYALGEPTFEQSEVIVRASSETLNKIAFVKALIDVSDVKEDFERDAELVAYDQKGNRINVDIRPTTMKTKVKVTQPNKSVPITLIPNGTVPNGKAIASYKLDNQSVTLYGSEETLAGINELPIYIPVNNITGNQRIVMPIVLPNGVKKASLKNVSIDIALEDSSSKTIDEIPIVYKNAEKLTFDVKTASNSKVDGYVSVSIHGTEKVLETINKEDISVYADFANVKEAGTYDIPLSVVGRNKLASYELAVTTIKLEFKTKE